ncbi:MAG: hypothetical protein IJY35_05420 [Clostridia bacterium]|nr:hypothetical protein [Clostridia bacterium]
MMSLLLCAVMLAALPACGEDPETVRSNTDASITYEEDAVGTDARTKEEIETEAETESEAEAEAEIETEAETEMETDSETEAQTESAPAEEQSL